MLTRAARRSPSAAIVGGLLAALVATAVPAPAADAAQPRAATVTTAAVEQAAVPAAALAARARKCRFKTPTGQCAQRKVTHRLYAYDAVLQGKATVWWGAPASGKGGYMRHMRVVLAKGPTCPTKGCANPRASMTIQRKIDGQWKIRQKKAAKKGKRVRWEGKRSERFDWARDTYVPAKRGRAAARGTWRWWNIQTHTRADVEYFRAPWR